MTSPTQRSLAKLRAEGWTCQIVERWNQYARVRQDLFNGIDIVCLKAGEPGVLGVQTTSDDNASKRVEKLNGIEALKLWVACSNRLVVHGWAKKGARGKRKLWTCREIEISFRTSTVDTVAAVPDANSIEAIAYVEAGNDG